MSNILKVFIVLNFVLAVVFVATAATLLGKADNWKAKYETLDEEKSAEIKTLTAKVNSEKARADEQETARQTAVEEKSALEVKLNSSEQQLVEKKRDYEKLNNNLTELREVQKTQAAALKQAQTDRETYERRMTAAEEKGRSATTAKETAENESRRLDTMIAQLKEDIAQLERDLTSTRKDLADNKNLVKVAIEHGFDLASLINAPPIEAVVQKVNSELKFVILSVGRDDKVVKGMRFHISRNGSYIGEVQVDTLYPKSCAASFISLKPDAEISAGDNAATRL